MNDLVSQPHLPSARQESGPFRVAAIAALAAVSLTLLVPTRGSAGVCAAYRTEDTTICTYSVVDGGPSQECFDVRLEGPALADTEWSGPQATLNWVVSQFDGEDPVLGQIHLELANSTPTTGVVLPVSTACNPAVSLAGCFPALNRNDFYFRIETDLYPPLLSDGPIRIEGMTDSIPPDGKIYQLVNGPVPLYLEGDSTRWPVLYIMRGIVRVDRAESGACLLPGGSCRPASAATCSILGGSYQGDDTSCPP